MISRGERLKKSHLYPVRKKALGRLSKLSNGIYLILDSGILAAKKIFVVAHAAASAGADLIQMREKGPVTKEAFKTAATLKKIARKFSIPFIINDNVALAVASGADGLHIGQGDIDLALARRLMKKDSIIGVSVKNYKQAVEAKEAGADYVGVGAVFKTPIKSASRPKGFGLLKKIRRLNMPAFAIGGINHENISKVIEEGFKNIAVIRAVCAARDPYRATRRLKETLSLINI